MASGGLRAAPPDGGAETDDSERLPRQFGRYLLFDRIGRGGVADIYLSRVSTEIGAGRRVVVKQILPALGADPQFARMLVDEAKLVAGLRHANVVQVLDLGREGDRLFIAMEYVEGFDLNQLLRQLSKQRIPLPAEFGLFVVREMLEALDFAHRARAEDGSPLGIVHRDVSPSNVLISFEGEVKLCDFGIAKAYGETRRAREDTDDARDELGGVVGKAAYMSPEHARGHDLDARSDLFSAGIVLWELCAGRRLYKGTEDAMLQLARDGAVPPLPERGIPGQATLQGILDRALAFDPSDRFATAAEMLRALDEYAMGAKLFASQLRFGSFLSTHFEEDLVRTRRHRELAAEALAHGPAAELVPLGDASDVGSTVAESPEASASLGERAAETTPSLEVTDAALRVADDTTKRLNAVVDPAAGLATGAEPPLRSGTAWGIGLAIAMGAGALAMLVVLIYLLVG